MDKHPVEEMCRRAGLRPEKRETIRGQDVFVAEGFCLYPEKHFPESVVPGEYPNGAYVCLFWTAKGEDRMEMGHTLFFEPGHDPQYDQVTRKRARINSALKRADEVMRIRGDEHARKV